MLDDILDISDALGTKIGYSKELEALYDACMSNQEVKDEIGQYLAFSNIQLKLIEDRSDEDIQRFLQPFIEDPVETIDHLMKVFNLFLLFGRSTLAVKLCEEVFEGVTKKSFWSCPEEVLAKAICCSELQKMLVCLQTENTCNWNDFDRVVRPFGYDFKESDYLRLEERLLGKIDSKEISKQFKKNFSSPAWDIQIAFCSYMWNEKKIPVCTSGVVATMILNFLASKIKSPNCSVDKFFTFTEEGLEEHVVSIIGTLLPCVEDGFTLVWGIPPFYKFLNNVGLVDNESLAKALSITDSIKNNLISNLPDSAKKYPFVNIFCDNVLCENNR